MNREFKCQHCYFIVHSKQSLIRHLSNHHKGQIKFKCGAPNCGKKYSTWASFKNHVSSKHSTKNPYVTADTEPIQNPAPNEIEVEENHERGM
jgi:hypothetical protein